MKHLFRRHPQKASTDTPGYNIFMNDIAPPVVIDADTGLPVNDSHAPQVSTASSSADSSKNARVLDPEIKELYAKIRHEKSIVSIIDILLELPDKRIDSRMIKLVEKYPNISAPHLVIELENAFLKQAGFSSAAVGAGAAYPGVGTIVAAGATAVELTAFSAESVFYILSVAKLCGVDSTDKDRRRALVLSSLMGDEGAKLVSDQLGLQTLAWARKSLQTMSSPTLGAVNKMLMKYTRKKVAQRLSGRLLGRLVPFGIGALVGWFSGRGVAKRVIEGTRAALGTPPDIPAATLLTEQLKRR
ncbi:MAG: hypothetical protein Q4P66_04360 [Actinomycetaceae bacterium]|nr:hypothetical protein [Actinomycetaceae bacterium]